MKSADSERDFNGFLPTVCVEPSDSQNNWRRRQFVDTVAGSILPNTAPVDRQSICFDGQKLEPRPRVCPPGSILHSWSTRFLALPHRVA
jgi:hypothetical protein